MYIGKKYFFITHDKRRFFGKLIALDTFGTLSFEDIIERIGEPKIKCIYNCQYCLIGEKFWSTCTFRLEDISYISCINDNEE